MVKRLITYEEPGIDLKKVIIKGYVGGPWGSSNGEDFEKAYASFFQEYNKLLKQPTNVNKNTPTTVNKSAPTNINNAAPADHPPSLDGGTKLDNVTNLAHNSHEHLMRIVEAIRRAPTDDRRCLHRALKEDPMFQGKEPLKIDRSINLALSLWLTLDFSKSTQLLEAPPVPQEQHTPPPKEEERPPQGIFDNQEGRQNLEIHRASAQNVGEHSADSDLQNAQRPPLEVDSHRAQTWPLKSGEKASRPAPLNGGRQARSDPIPNNEGQHLRGPPPDLEGQHAEALRDWLAFLLQPFTNLIPKSITQRVQTYQDQGPLQWEGTRTLECVVSQRFQNLRSVEVTKNGVTLQTSFTAVNLQRFCGIEIELMCNLVEHLEFNRELRILKIYPLKGYLYDMKRRYEIDFYFAHRIH
jgi:hypothetical protein